MESKYPLSLPYIDLENYPNNISEIDKNAWDSFFLQPSNISFNSKLYNYILSDAGTETMNYEIPYIFDYEVLKINGWSKIFDKYIHLRSDILLKFESDVPAFFLKKVLGVKIRGSDYTAVKPKDHHIQPSIETYIKHIEIAMSKFDFDYIFLASEDLELIEKFKLRYGDLLIINNSKLLEYNGDGFIMSHFTNNQSKYAVTRDYLFELFLLSKCDGLISGKTSGVIFSLLLNRGKYKYTDIIDIGTYK
jgi:hypothetical protein